MEDKPKAIDLRDAERIGNKIVTVPKSIDAQVGRLFELAIEKGLSVEGLEKLVMLHERVADRAAAQEFAAALAGFQESCPPIPKTSKANISTKSGIRYSYQYAELDTIETTIRPHLRPVGLAYSWDSTTENDRITAICTLRHTNGHTERASFSCPAESKAGMSEQQKYAAALTYARRQSLIQALGLTTTDPDTDAVSTDTITAKQAADLEALCSEVGANPKKFLAYLDVGDFDKIRAAEYASAVAALERKRSGA